MTRPWLLVLSILLALTACGSSFELDALQGTWTGQFPASEGDEGVELHFQPDYAFFVQKGKRVARQRLVLERNGSQLRLTLTSQTDPKNQAVFNGRLIDANTASGRYINTWLKEDFDLTLVQPAR